MTSARSGCRVQVRTGAWYGDRPLTLEFPAQWDVTVLWPRTPPRLTDAGIRAGLEQPVGQRPIRELCRGSVRPLVIVDDLNRPTPAARIMPALLRQLSDGGIPAHQVTILMAGGSHGASPAEACKQKIGREAARACRFLVHDPRRDTVLVGTTSLGTPVLVNREVLAADFVVGIGGIYPNHTAGFGGGSKLLIGALDLRVISYLHHRYASVGWGGAGMESDFRRDLDEIARMIRLQCVISAHVDADRELVRLVSGDPQVYYRQEVAFARDAFRAPPPDGADVVIANAFPNDLSVTFVFKKGDFPLRCCAPGSSRVAIAACSEGEGAHAIYPVVGVPILHELRDRLGRLSLLPPREIAAKLARRLRWVPAPPAGAPPQARAVLAPALALREARPVWLFRTSPEPAAPTVPREARLVHAWSEAIHAVRREQGAGHRLRVLVYPCAPLQVLDEGHSSAGIDADRAISRETR